MKKIFLLLVSLYFLTSCEKEFEESTKQNETIAINEITVENGRISFPNKKTFKAYYNKIKDEDESIISAELENKFYSKDFYSLIPIADDKSQEKQFNRHLNKYREILKTIENFKNGNLEAREIDESLLEHFDDIEEVLGEDVFISFLNENAEILVNDTIYKYTDKGLLLAKEEYIDDLYEFMQNNNVKSLSDFNEIDLSGEYPVFNLNGGYKNVDENVDSYLASKIALLNNPTDPTDGSTDYIYTGGSSGTGTSSTSTTSNITSNEELTTIINNLAKCTPDTPFGFGNLFGTTKVCIKRFGSAQRVKIKYYSVDFLLAYAIGIKVKHQHKGFVFWTRQDTSEMALGVNSVTWYFDHSKVFNNTSYSLITNFYTPYDGKYYRSLNSYNNAVYMGQDVPLPPLPFASDVDIIIETANHYLGTNLTESQVRYLFYNEIYDQAKSILQAQGKEMKKVGVILNQSGQTIIQYYDFRKRCTDCSKLEKVFDWGVVTPQINYTFGPGGGFNIPIGFNSLTFDFKHPNVTHLSVYGLAKRSGQWHGYKMEF